MGERARRAGVLFIPYKAGQIAALRSTISAWMRLAIFEAMDREARSRRLQEESGRTRLWFVVDELDALGQIDGLKDALARLRKFDGRCVLGFQSIAQVSGTYGPERCPHDHGKLRQHPDPPLLRQRRRRYGPIRLPADRRARGPAHRGIEEPATHRALGSISPLNTTVWNRPCFPRKSSSCPISRATSSTRRIRNGAG